MNIFLTGATGFIGSYLRTMLLRKGYLLTIVTRAPEKYESETAQNQRFVSWEDDLTAEMENADAVINMAGETIFGQRWTEEVKHEIYSSRVDSTRQIVHAINSAQQPPSVFISTSAAGYYGSRGDLVLDESTDAGEDFLARVCIAWEAAARKVKEEVRLVIPRFGIPLEKEGGALKQMLPAFQFFVGGPVGSGKQYFPWIHMHDLCRALLFLLEQEHIRGAVNVSSPNPVTMKEFAQELAGQLQRPSIFRVPEFALKLVLGEAAGPIVNSLRLQPKKLQKHGFDFRFKQVREALGDVL